MTSQRKGSLPRHRTGAHSRAADARALRAARSSAAQQARSEAEEPHVPSFLMASPPPAALEKAAAEKSVPPKSREELIAETAYLRAAGRGFEPGHDLDDWLAAEELVDAHLAGKPE
jgi:hypothetical protein